MGRRRGKKQQKPKPKAKPEKSSAIGEIARTVGGAIGSLVGMKEAGRDAGSWLAKVTGLGVYHLHQNSFTKSSAAVPTFEYQPDGSVIVTHREFVREITGSTTFSSQTFDICPTNEEAFPWLRIIALAYEQYEFLGLLACYVPSSGDAIASTNNALGTIQIATEYDVSRPAFASKSELEQSLFVTSDKPSEHQIHPVECNPNRDTINARYMEGPFRARYAAVGNTASTVAYPDVENNLRCTGRLQISTSGQQAVTTIGDFWWAYKVKFSKPRGLPPGALGGYLSVSCGATTQITGDVQFKNAIIMANSTSGTNSIGFNTALTGLTFTGLRPGTVIDLMFTAGRTSGTTAGYTMGTPTYVSCGAVLGLFQNTSSPSSDYIVSGSSTYSRSITLRITEATYLTPATLTFTNPTIGASDTWIWDLRAVVHPSYGNVVVPALTVTPSMELEQIKSIIEDMRRRELHSHSLPLGADEKEPGWVRVKQL
jgi:hypothetical protein